MRNILYNIITMYEFTPGAEPDRPDMSLVEDALNLGYPLSSLDVASEMRPVYTERDKIIAETAVHLRERHAAYAYVAQQAGLRVSVPPFEEWKPQGIELAAMQSELRRQKVRMQMLDGLSEFVSSDKYMSKLRPQQRDAMYATQPFMEIKPRMKTHGGTELFGKSGYNDMPTGTGKTGVLVSSAQALKLKESPDDPVKVLVLVPTKQLLRQTIGDTRLKPRDRTGFAKFAPGLRPTVFYQDEKNFSDLTVMTNASFNRLVQDGTMPEFDAILVDESHTDLGENISDSLRQYYGDKLTIGFSATPDYHEEKMTAHLLDHEIFRLSLPDAIETGCLAPVHAEHRPLTLEFDESQMPQDPAERRNTIAAAYCRERLRDSMKDIKDAIRQGDGVLVRCPPGGDITFAKMAADILQGEFVTTEDRTYSGKILAASVGGSKQKLRDLELLLSGFNKQKVQVITYVDIINMGADLPPAKLLVDLWPTESRVKMLQGMGRVLRLVMDEHRQPKMAKVITYRDPGLPNQYSCLDALNLRPGQAKLTQQREYRPQYEGSLFSYTEVMTRATPGAVGKMAIRHGEGIVYEDAAEPEDLSFEDACRQFGLDPEIAARYLDDVGYEGTPSLPEDEYEALAQLIAEDREPRHEEAVPIVEQASPGADLPANYLLATELTQKYNWRGTTASFIRELRAQGVPVRRQKVQGKTTFLVSKEFIPDEYL